MIPVFAQRASMGLRDGVRARAVELCGKRCVVYADALNSV